MGRNIAKIAFESDQILRLKDKLMAMGCEIHDPHFISEPDGKRKFLRAEILFNNWIIYASGKDELDLYRDALECVTDILDKRWDKIFQRTDEGDL